MKLFSLAEGVTQMRVPAPMFLIVGQCIALWLLLTSQRGSVAEALWWCLFVALTIAYGVTLGCTESAQYKRLQNHKRRLAQSRLRYLPPTTVHETGEHLGE